MININIKISHNILLQYATKCQIHYQCPVSLGCQQVQQLWVLPEDHQTQGKSVSVSRLQYNFNTDWLVCTMNVKYALTFTQQGTNSSNSLRSTEAWHVNLLQHLPKHYVSQIMFCLKTWNKIRPCNLIIMSTNVTDILRNLQSLRQALCIVCKL